MMIVRLVLLPTSSIVTRGCVVAQEDIRRKEQIAFMHITLEVKQQLMAIMLMAY